MQITGNSPQPTGNKEAQASRSQTAGNRVLVGVDLPPQAQAQMRQAFASLDAIKDHASRIQAEKTMRPGYVEARAEYAKQHDRLQKTTQDFEAVFVGMMLKQMRKSIGGKNELFGNSPEAKTYQDMADDATAKQMSKVGTFGLARVMFKSMSHTLPPNPDEE